MSTHPDRVRQASRTQPTPGQTAQAAADRAGVRVEEVRNPEVLTAIEQLFQTVWSTQRGRPPINADVLRAMAHSGSYVAAAHDLQGRLAGAGVGFLAADVFAGVHSEALGIDSLHSHIAAVAPGNERHGIGRALKLHQRAWAIRHGLRSISWTFDPLVRRNAAFNAHLGAQFVRYYPDFYGDMADGRNIGQGSDRLLARWALDASATGCAADDPTDQQNLLLDQDSDGRPVLIDATGDRLWVATPADIELVRRSDPDLAQAWRIALRNALDPRMPGWRIDGFTPAGRYLLVHEHDTHRSEEAR